LPIRSGSDGPARHWKVCGIGVTRTAISVSSRHDAGAAVVSAAITGGDLPGRAADSSRWAAPNTSCPASGRRSRPTQLHLANTDVPHDFGVIVNLTAGMTWRF
jgi:hypothetical protein